MLLSKDDKREEKGFGGAIHGSELKLKCLGYIKNRSLSYLISANILYIKHALVDLHHKLWCKMVKIYIT